MNRLLQLALFALPMGLLAGTCQKQQPQLDELWHTDLAQASEAAVESGKPMLVVFR